MKKTVRPAVSYLDSEEVDRHLAPARSIDARRTARSCAACAPVQHRRPHPGGLEPMPEHRSANLPSASETLRQRPKGTDLPAVARDRAAAHGTPKAASTSRSRTTVRQSLRSAAGRRWRALQARPVRSGCSKRSAIPAIKTRTPAHVPSHRGVQMVTAGVDITVIRSWLGHVSLDTTNHYARANIETKRRAIELVDRSTRPSGPPRWKRNPNLLAWLDSL